MVDPERALAHSEGAALREAAKVEAEKAEAEVAARPQSARAPITPRPKSAMDKSKVLSQPPSGAGERPRTAGPRPGGARAPPASAPGSRPPSGRAIVRVSSAMEQLLLCRERQKTVLSTKSRPGFFNASGAAAADAARPKRDPITVLLE